MDLFTTQVEGQKHIPCPRCGGRKERHIIKTSGEIKTERCNYCQPNGTVPARLQKKGENHGLQFKIDGVR